MKKYKVFMSGITSFTGAHIARALKIKGHYVIASLSTIRARYESDALLKQRLLYADPDEIIENCVFGSGNMLDALKRLEPEIFINHGAPIKGYRSPDFDYLQSVASSLQGARTLMQTLQSFSCKRFIHSGSVFEADEGSTNSGMTPSSESVSLYGASKAMVWTALRFFASESKVPVSKIVITNPIGIFENTDRLIPIFVKMWKEQKVPVLKTPQLIRDNIPAEWLAQTYVDEVELACDPAKSENLVSPRIRRPSGFVMTNQDFLEDFIRKLQAAKFPHPCPLKIEMIPTSEPLERLNTEHVKEISKPEKIEEFWRTYSESFVNPL